MAVISMSECGGRPAIRSPLYWLRNDSIFYELARKVPPILIYVARFSDRQSQRLHESRVSLGLYVIQAMSRGASPPS